MISVKNFFPENGWQPMIPASAENSFINSPKCVDKKDLFTNLSFNNAIFRCVITIFFLVPLFIINETLIIYIAPLVAYLFTSAILRFCVVKYVWDRYGKHKPVPITAYPQGAKYPSESLSSITNF
jgi:hypothetical protein